MNKKYFYGGFAAVIVVVTLVFAWTRIATPDNSAPVCSLNIPEQLGSLPRTDFISGPEAIKQISMMHGTEIVLTEGHIAKYKGDGKEVVLWVSVSPTAEEGKQLFVEMDEKMPVSKVFTGREEVEVNGMKMIKVKGMGQEHYYWVNGKYNYWVAVGGTDALPVLKEVLGRL